MAHGFGEWSCRRGLGRTVEDGGGETGEKTLGAGEVERKEVRVACSRPYGAACGTVAELNGWRTGGTRGWKN